MDRDNTTILIDGYNYIGTINGLVAPRLRMQRDGLVDMLRRYYRLRGIRIIVIFDSHESVQTWNKKKIPGVTVKFTPPGMIADDWIVNNLHKISGIVGVITDDRELRRRIEKKSGFWVPCKDFKQAVEAFYMAQTDPEEPEPVEKAPHDDEVRAEIEERDSGVWDMFLATADVKPLHGSKPVRASKKTTESADAMIMAMSRVTKQVIKEKNAGMADGKNMSGYLSRDEIFRRRQIAFLALLRGLDR